MKDVCAERKQELTEKQRGAGETLHAPTGTVARSEAIHQKTIARVIS
jgi:hypothetical protein